MNLLERELHYPFGDTLPAPGETIEVAPGVRWIRMALPFALDHINLWLLRDTLDGVEGWTVVDCCIAHDASRAQWEQIFATPARRPADPARDRHAHASRPHRPGRLAVPALERAAVDQRHRLPRGARAHQRRRHVAGGDAAADFFASHGLDDPESVAKIRARTNYYVTWCPRCRPVRAHARRRHGRDRRPRMALHQRLRPRARAHRALLRRAQRAARRRHDAAAHLDQRERACGRAGGQFAAPLPRQHRALQVPAGRHAGPAFARQALHRHPPARRAAAGTSPRPPGRAAGGLHREGRTARPRRCRSCSSASSTCTR